MRRRLRALARNPFTIVIPLVLVLWLGWGHYISAARDLSRPTNNLLPSGAFDTFTADFVPAGWQVARSGDFTYTTGKTPGYVAGSAWSFTVKDYKNGNAALTSPKVALRANTKYLYKGFYQATVPFDLLVRYYYADGSSQLQYVASYPNEGQWTTASLGFATGQNITAVAFSYHIAGNGTVRFDGTYLEPKQSGLYIAPQPPSLPSRIPNGNLAVATDTLPEGWSSFTSGTNHSSFAYQKEQNDTYLQAVTTDYRDGEAKWQYAPQAVQGSQQLRFAVDYRATAPAEVMAEYVLEDGSRQFETLATVGPTNQWTQRATTLETPAMARSLFVSVVLHRNGTLDTKDYTLSDVTRPGAARFKRPLVSVTFDDGWQSSYTNGARILDQSGYKGTYFLNPSVIDTDKFFTTMQVDDLQRRGHELSAHGYNHLDMTTINPGQIMFQLEGAARYIKQKTNTTAIDYASPYGKSDAEVQFYARNYFRSMRGTSSGLNTKQNFNPYDLRVLYVGNKTTPQEITEALNDARANDGWLVLVYHRVEQPDARTADSNVIVAPQTFEQQVDLLKKSAIPVVTVHQAMDELESQVD